MPTSSRLRLSFAYPLGLLVFQVVKEYDIWNLLAFNIPRPSAFASMPDRSILAKLYAEGMTIHGHGHGFCETEGENILRPGVCGYVDDTGLWQPIVDLTDRKALERHGYTKPRPLIRAAAAEAVWKETTSESVTSTRVQLDAGADATLAAAAVHFGLEKSIQSGAVLLCNTTVFRQGYAHEDPFRRWGKENAKTILKNCPDVKEYGFFLARTTWASEDVWITAWTATQKTVSIGLEVRAEQAGQLSSSVQYHNGHSAGGWVHPVREVKVRLHCSWATEGGGADIDRKKGKPVRRVLFAKGIQFKYRVAVAGIVSL
jgi:hypothetical protein